MCSAVAAQLDDEDVVAPVRRELAAAEIDAAEGPAATGTLPAASTASAVANWLPSPGTACSRVRAEPVELRHEGVRAGGGERAAAEIDGPLQLAGHDHVAVRVERDGSGVLAARVAEAAAPHVLAGGRRAVAVLVVGRVARVERGHDLPPCRAPRRALRVADARAGRAAPTPRAPLGPV